jgi:DNA-binding GntR family transcriptional regulator
VVRRYRLCTAAQTRHPPRRLTASTTHAHEGIEELTERLALADGKPDREAILDTAQRQFLEGGYAATTIAAVAALLDLPEDAQVLVRRYLMLVDGEPVQLADSYFPAELAEGSIISHQENITPGRIDADLKERFGLEPARFLDELTVRMPTAEEIRSLRLPPGTPVASLLRTYRDPTGKPFEVAHFVLAGDKHILVYEGEPSTPA